MSNNEIVQLKSYDENTGQEIGNVLPITNSEAVKTEDNKTLKQKLTEINKQIEQTNASLDKSKKLNMYRYLMTTFTASELDDSNSHLLVYLSNDGEKWYKYSEYNKHLRDPFCFRYNNYYYIIATNLINRTSVTYLKTKDFINFEEITSTYTGLSDFGYIWAPSVFKYNNELYMTLSLSPSGTVDTLGCYISKLDENLVPSTFTKLTGNLPTSYYDTHFIVSNDKIYIYYKNSTSGQTGIQIAQSDNLLTGYEIVGYNNLDNQQEAPYYLKLGDNTLRMYMDTHQGVGGISFIDYKDSERTWTSPKSIIFDDSVVGKHCHIIDLSGFEWEKTYRLNPSCYTLKDCNELLFGKYSNRLTTNTTLNLPQISDGDKWGKVELLDLGSNKIQLFTSLSLRMFVRNYVNSTWSSWREFERTNINDWKNISLSSNVSSYDEYTTPCYKQEGNVVWIKGVVKGITTNDTIIGNLPIGVRPLQTWSYTQKGLGNGTAFLTIEKNGDIKFQKNSASTFDATGWQPIHCYFRID